MKPDELLFLKELFNHHGGKAYSEGNLDRAFADEVAQKIGIHDKRSYYLICKWDDKGWWNSGVSLRSGWFTPEGVEAIREILARAAREKQTKEDGHE